MYRKKKENNVKVLTALCRLERNLSIYFTYHPLCYCRNMTLMLSGCYYKYVSKVEREYEFRVTLAIAQCDIYVIGVLLTVVLLDKGNTLYLIYSPFPQLKGGRVRSTDYYIDSHRITFWIVPVIFFYKSTGLWEKKRCMVQRRPLFKMGQNGSDLEVFLIYMNSPIWGFNIRYISWFDVLA